MTRAPLVMVIVLLVTLRLPARAQEGGKSGAAVGAAVVAAGGGDNADDFGGDSTKPPDNKTKPDELGDIPPVKQGAAVVADLAKAAMVGSPAAVPQFGASPEQAAAIKQEIGAALERNDEPAARQLMSQALRQFPNDRELKNVRSSLWTHLPEGKAKAIIESAYADAAKLFGRQWLPGNNPDDDVVLSIEKGPRRGTPMFGSGRPVAAVAQGYSYLDRGYPERAEQVLTQAIRRHANSAELYYARVMARALNGNLKGADGDSLRAVTLSHQQSVVLSQRASLMLEMGRRDEAFAWANRALESNPQDADALSIRGRYFWRDLGRPESALEDLKKASQIDPKRYGALFQEGERRYYEQRAVSSLNRGDLRQAFTSAGLALQADPGDVQAHLVRGMVFWKMGKPEETIKDTTLALKTDPRSTWALFHRGLAMEALGRRDFAIADFRRAAAINPKKFGPLLDRLLRAQRDGQRSPVFPREGQNPAPPE